MFASGQAWRSYNSYPGGLETATTVLVFLVMFTCLSCPDSGILLRYLGQETRGQAFRVEAQASASFSNSVRSPELPIQAIVGR